MAVLLLFLSGCGKTGTSEPRSTTDQASSEPVALKLMVTYGSLSDEEFQAYFVDQLAKKYPNITVERVNGKLADLITAGEIPDLLMSGLPGIPALQELDVIEDLSPFIKKGLDLSQYNPDAINAIKTFSNTGEMLAVPFRLNVPALFYNKDIFDMFGIPYPQDGMTWEEATSLARTLTRNEGGMQYTGLLVGGADRMAMGLVLPYVDKKTNKAMLETDAWQGLLKQYNAIYSLPGYITGGKVPDTITKLMKDKTDAMATFWYDGILAELKKMATNGQPLNWDMVTVPTFDKGKGYAWQVESQNLLITSTSKHKEQAFQVISYLTGDEVQKLQNKSGEVPVLRETKELQKDFGTDLPILKGKHTDALFMLPQGLHQHTKYDQKGRSLINAAADSTVLKGININTALQDAQEKLNQYIAEQNAK
jgi:multiple sugar transport system substrate-binding protein